MPRENMLGTIVSELKRARRKGRTVTEIVKTTGITDQTVRKHLKTLVDRGDAGTEMLEPTGVGRPPRVYFLSRYRPATAS